MTSLGYIVPLHRILAFGFAAFLASLAGVLLVWQGQIAPGDVGLGATIDLLIVAVIGGLGRVEGARVGALAFIVINNYIRDSWLIEALDTVRIGGSFNTIIGVVFLLIVVLSPDGLMASGTARAEHRAQAPRRLGGPGGEIRPAGLTKGGIGRTCQASPARWQHDTTKEEKGV